MIAPARAEYRHRTAHRAANALARMHDVRASSATGFDVATRDRRRRAFSPANDRLASADHHLKKTTLEKIRELCRAHDRNASIFSGLLNRALDNIFGPSFATRPATGDESLDAAAADYIAERSTARLADASGRRELADIARTALRAVWNDGDCLLVQRRNGSLLPFEADQVVTPETKPNDDRRIVLGVELDRVNRPTGYHLRQRLTSGDHGYTQRGRRETTTRIAARWTIHPAYLPRFNQTRGLPFLTSALAIYDRLDGYLDNETLAAELNATGGWKITAEPNDTDLDGVEDNEDGATNEQFEKIQTFEPGFVAELRPGEDLAMVAADRPGATFEPYVITACRLVGAAVGFPLELLLLDFSRTNYSSARAGLMEARRSFRYWQRFADAQIVAPWYAWQISRGIALGDLPPEQSLYNYRSQWPAWGSVDPLKEANANQVQIANAAKSISEVIRERGRDPLDVFDEIAADNAQLEKRGIRTQFVPTTGAAAAAAAAEDADADRRPGDPE